VALREGTDASGVDPAGETDGAACADTGDGRAGEGGGDGAGFVLGEADDVVAAVVGGGVGFGGGPNDVAEDLDYGGLVVVVEAGAGAEG